MLQVICGFVVGLLLAGLGFGLVGGGVPGLIVAVVLAALGYIAASTLTEPERRIGKMLVSALPNGQKTADTIDAANARLNSIAMLTKQVRDPAVKAEANDFIAATKDLVQYVTRDTSAYPTLRHYITVYGEQTEKLLRSYVDVEGVLKRPLIRHWDPLRTPMFARGFVVSWVRFPVSRNVVLQHSPTNLRVDLRNDFGSLRDGHVRASSGLVKARVESVGMLGHVG